MKYKSKKIDFNSDDYESMSISDLKRICDYQLRQFLLRRGGNSNYIFCPIKNRSYSQDQMEVAHFIDRGIMATRYDLSNCHLISNQSNSFDAQILAEGYKSKHHKEYAEWLGDKIVADLQERSKKLTILTRQDYINIIEKFKGNE